MAEFSDDVNNDISRSSQSLMQFLRLVYMLYRRQGQEQGRSGSSAGPEAAGQAARGGAGGAQGPQSPQSPQSPQAALASLPPASLPPASLDRELGDTAGLWACADVPSELDGRAGEIADNLCALKGRDCCAVFRDDAGTHLIFDTAAVSPADIGALADAYGDAPADRPLDLSAAATPNQMRLIGELAEEGVVGRDELKALGDSPTMGQANALLNAHADRAGRIDMAGARERSENVAKKGVDELFREADRFEDLGNVQPDTHHVMRQTNSYDGNPATPYPDQAPGPSDRTDAETPSWELPRDPEAKEAFETGKALEYQESSCSRAAAALAGETPAPAIRITEPVK